MMEYFAASGGPPLAECLEWVTPCDLAIVLAAQRYGWVPPDQTEGEAKSITWLACEYAVGPQKDPLVFVLDKKFDWPAERKESYRPTAVLEDGSFKPELIWQVKRNKPPLVWRPNATAADDPPLHLEWLREPTATIDIRGLGATGSGKRTTFRLKIFTSRSRRQARRGPNGSRWNWQKRCDIGAGGSGKTTFLRRITYALTSEALAKIDFRLARDRFS
jgi:hypothetical protein